MRLFVSLNPEGYWPRSPEPGLGLGSCFENPWRKREKRRSEAGKINHIRLIFAKFQPFEKRIFWVILPKDSWLNYFLGGTSLLNQFENFWDGVQF